MTIKYYFLAGIFPDEMYEDIIINSKGSIQFAADALQKSFIEGFSEEYEGIEIVNVPFIQPYPQRYRKMCITEKETVYNTHKGKKIPCHCLPFCNLYELKKYSIEKAIHKYFSFQLQNTNESIVIIIYAITTSALNACRLLKKKYGNRVKTVLIVPDLPQYIYDNTKLLHRVYFKYQNRMYNHGYEYIDAFVLLSKYMSEALPVKGKPWTVVEGIYNLRDDYNYQIEYNRKEKVVFYAGSLSMKYGIKNLVDAFMMTKDDNYCLQICGSGDAVRYLKECAIKDLRINYLGQLPRTDVIELQRKATLLVNPRTTEGEYTKYSFPSKTMEYFASGVPTLIYKLPGIPNEYFSYCFSLNDESVEALYKELVYVLSMDENELKDIGRKARQFVLIHKNPYEQCKKIKSLTDFILK